VKVYVVIYNKGCHECAGTAEAVFATRTLAETYVAEQSKLRGYPRRNEGLEIQECTLWWRGAV